MTTAIARLRPYLPLLGIAVLAYVLLVWAPGTMTPFRLGNLGKYCALALASMGIGLAWGRGGMLVLGQGVFFGLGAYAMAMHMKLEAAGPGQVPDFMVLYGDGTMPSWWEPFRSGPFTLFAIIAVPAGVLAHGQKQWLEVGMLLVQDAKVMFLDETVAGMSPDEREETGELLKRIAGDRTIVIIEHDMEFMRRYADFVTVMHSGTVLAEGTVAVIQADPQVQEVYLGTAREAAASG